MKAPKQEEKFNLERHEPAIGYTETNKVYKHSETHIYSREYGFCKGIKNSLENMSKWPPHTVFKIVPSTKLNGRIYSKKNETVNPTEAVDTGRDHVVCTSAYHSNMANRKTSQLKLELYLLI